MEILIFVVCTYSIFWWMFVLMAQPIFNDPDISFRWKSFCLSACYAFAGILTYLVFAR